MNENGNSLLNNTWNRAMQPILKIGYMDGAADGQVATFQSSFNMGYAQGLSFGIELGFKKGISISSKTNKPRLLRELQNINCQICLNEETLEKNIGNLYNNQQEKNMLLLEENDNKNIN